MKALLWDRRSTAAVRRWNHLATSELENLVRSLFRGGCLARDRTARRAGRGAPVARNGHWRALFGLLGA